MANINWNDVHFWDLTVANAIVLWKILRVAPGLIARALPPLLKFVASSTGKYAINDYLDKKYPKKVRKNGRSSSN
jgi:hypothetical protein